ncbi:MAG: acyl-CoA dehydrogenase family protein [Candidatus Rokubacteria bacterium]|nr:acyl-CoA dehydrogenase family protein [Candidatus Rokubacteria bacterium]MBI3104293.1 acyl-CoA dehydrogenase family protein [Candidatus Rokubacteria bacterium]
MDLNYTPEDVAFRKSVRAWLEQNLPRNPIRTLEERRVWHRKLSEAGYLGMGWPKAYGGGDARPMEQAIVADELARASAPAPTNGLGLGIVGPTIVVHGTDAQKTRYLKKILTAEELWCQLYSEPNAGSDLAALRTSAEDKGDHFIVNGQKTWTSAGSIADWGLLLARTDPAVAKHKGITCFLINMRQPGIEVRPLKQITGSSEFSEVFMTSARVEKTDQIGRLGEGWAIAQTTLGYERGGRALARITSYASQYGRLVEVARRLKRHGRPLIDDPVIRQKLGRIWAELEVERYGALRMLTLLERGEHPGAGGSLTKLSYSEFEKRFIELAMEILGPYGQLTEGAPEELRLEIDTAVGEQGTWAYAFLWSRAGTIYAGSSEIQKNVIGERILGLPKEARADRVGSAR